MNEQSLLHYTIHNEIQKETVLFLHGGGSASWMWDEVVALLPQYRCIPVDLPQHGKSQSVSPFSMPFAADKVAEIIHLISHEKPVHLVGLSEGAQVAVQMLAAHHTLVKTAFISSALLLSVAGASMFGSDSVARWSYRLALKPFKNWNGWIRLNMRYAAGIPEKYYAQFKQDFQNTSEDGFVNLMLANQHFRLPTGLEQVQVPVLAVCGHKEYAAMKSSLKLLAGTLPNATAYLLNLGNKTSLAEEHNWALTQPNLFASALDAWIQAKKLPPELWRQ